MAEEAKSVTFSNQEQVTANDRPEADKQTPPAIDVEALKQSIVSEVKTILVENQKHEQGLRKKLENRVAKTMNDIVAAQRAAGVEMTKEQSQILESSVRQQVEADDSQVDETPTPQAKPADKKADPVTEHVNRTVQKIYEKAGITLEESDPEAQDLKGVTDPVEFVELVREKVAEKAKRVNVSPEARIPGMGAGFTPGSETKDSLGTKLNELLKDPTKNDKQIREVSAKLKPLIQ